MDEKAGPTDFGASQKSILRVSNTFCINPLYIDIGFQSWHKLYYCKFSVVKNINTKSNGHFKLSICKGEADLLSFLAKIQFNSVVFPK
jgi:hypothetical protein